MNKKEAMKKAIDGHRVRLPNWSENSYVYFRFYQFLNENGNPACFANWADDDWEVAPKYVNFFEAWRAHEEGKHIGSEFMPGVYWGKCGEDENVKCFTRKEIRGRWLVMEG